jgi:hypothetical protein
MKAQSQRSHEVPGTQDHYDPWTVERAIRIFLLLQFMGLYLVVHPILAQTATDSGYVGIQLVRALDDSYTGRLGGFIITSVKENSPAFNAGIKPGDLIVAVNQEGVFGKPTDQIIGLSGPVGATVSFTIKRPGVDHAISVEGLTRVRQSWAESTLKVMEGISAANERAVVPNLGANASDAQDGQDLAWRCSRDGKAYRVEISDTFLRIRPIRLGTIAADIPIRRDKKGRTTIEGQFQSGLDRGLLVVQQLSDGYIAGHMLVPVSEANAASCTSRKSAILGSLGGQIVCTALAVSWDRLNDLSIGQAAADESLQAAYPPSTPTAPSRVSVPINIVGEWKREIFEGGTSRRLWLTLNANGTYEKTMSARAVGVGQLPATTQTGTWTANGTVVHLSADGSTIDLASWQRGR